MFIKLFTNPTFDREGFANMLINTMKVPAVAVSDGIILEKEKFNAYPLKLMPQWAWLNREDINSKYHTRLSSTTEYLRACKLDPCMIKVVDKLFNKARIMTTDEYNTKHNKDPQRWMYIGKA